MRAGHRHDAKKLAWHNCSKGQLWVSSAADILSRWQRLGLRGLETPIALAPSLPCHARPFDLNVPIKIVEGIQSVRPALSLVWIIAPVRIRVAVVARRSKHGDGSEHRSRQRELLA